MATETVETYDGQGNLVDTRVEEISPERFNRDSQRQKLEAARQTFRTNYANWATLTNGQKDAANRNAQRALGNLLGYLLEHTDDPGD